MIYTVTFNAEELRVVTMAVRKRLDDIMPDHPDNEILHDAKDKLMAVYPTGPAVLPHAAPHLKPCD